MVKSFIQCAIETIKLNWHFVDVNNVCDKNVIYDKISNSCLKAIEK